jgi:hypothetical protein
MKTFQITRNNSEWTVPNDSHSGIKNPDLVICFGNKQQLKAPNGYEYILKTFPESTVIVASTSGEISNDAINDDTIVATGITFEHSNIITHKVNVKEYSDSYQAGKSLAEKFNSDGLRLIFVLSDGQLVNGGDLVNGLNERLSTVPIAGGLAGDGANFQSTVVGLNDDLNEGNIVAVGFYGDRLRLGAGSKGGWDKFGPMRTITKSEKNILYEIDGENALDLYKQYLGEYADKLPGSALLFPLAILESDGRELVRTILTVDKDSKSMTFAGNMPEGAKVRLMKANLDNLAAAAADAAELSNISEPAEGDKLAILISCVGRKLIFGNRIDEELEAAREVIGANALITGFYSYGEIAPFSTFMKCELHNQTMTITTICEE